MKAFKLPKRRQKGDPKMRLRPHPSDKENIPMDEYFKLYGRLMGKDEKNG